MTAGGPSNSSQVLGTWLYRNAFLNDDMGYAAAIATVIFVITLRHRGRPDRRQPTPEDPMVIDIRARTPAPVRPRHGRRDRRAGTTAPAHPLGSQSWLRVLIWVGLGGPRDRGPLPAAVDGLQQLQGQPRGLRQPVGAAGRAALAQLRARPATPGVVRYFTNSVIVTSASIVTTDADQRLGRLRPGPAARSRSAEPVLAAPARWADAGSDGGPDPAVRPAAAAAASSTPTGRSSCSTPRSGSRSPPS